MARLKVTHIVYYLDLFLTPELVLVISYKNNKLLSGILYLHRITDNRVAGSSLRNLRMFQKLCGRDALDKVYFTTTMWDEIERTLGEKRLEELITNYWKTMISHGAQVARCRKDDDSPKNLVRHIVTFLVIYSSAHIESTSHRSTPNTEHHRFSPPLSTSYIGALCIRKKSHRNKTSRREEH